MDRTSIKGGIEPSHSHNNSSSSSSSSEEEDLSADLFSSIEAMSMVGKILDYTLVPSGFLLMAAYHMWLFYRVTKHPNSTVIGVNAVNRRFWVRAMMEDQGKNGVLAVQTMRNNIMASTLLASTAITSSSLIAILMSSVNARQPWFMTVGGTSQLGLALKVFSILVCFLVSFLMCVQSVRYYSHASMLINVPPLKSKSPDQLYYEYVAGTVNRGGYFWSLGLRAYYFSFPVFLWLFGPVPMFLCCLFMVFLLFSLDFTSSFAMVAEVSDDEEHGI